jgi:hypothetical protein
VFDEKVTDWLLRLLPSLHAVNVREAGLAATGVVPEPSCVLPT